MRLPSLLILASLPAAAAAQPVTGDAQSDGRPLLVANADGSWTITRPIHEAPVSLAHATGGLIADAGADGSPIAEAERERLRQAEAEDRIEQAFEEAVDRARQAEGPR